MGKRCSETLAVIFSIVCLLGAPGNFTIAPPVQSYHDPTVLVPNASTASAQGDLYVTPNFTAPMALHSNFTVSVKVAAIDQFDGWETQLVYDPNVINATSPLSLSISGNIFQANTTGGIAIETVHCVNGAGTGCCLTNACSPRDGAGIIHSVYGSTNTVTNGYGLLFNATFEVVSSGPYSPIAIKNDLISSSSGQGVAHTTDSGSYGIAPDFIVSAQPSTLSVELGSSNTSTITVTSVHNFAGKINITVIPPGYGIAATLSSNQTSLAAGGSSLDYLSIIIPYNVAATVYTVSVNATSGSLSRLLEVTVSVQVPDFVVGANPSDLLTHQSSSNSTVIVVKSIKAYAGTVTLQVTGPDGTTASLAKTSLFVPSDGSANTTLTISTQASTIRFRDAFTVVVTDGTLSHSTQIVAEPPPGDFKIFASLSQAVVQAGNSGEITIGIASQDYYVGTMYLLATSESGLRLAFDPGSAYLNYSQTVFSTLKVTTDASTSPGNHTIALTVVGQFGQTIQHGMQITFEVSAQPQSVPQVHTFLGLQAPFFFAIIIGLGILVAVVGFWDARRARRTVRRRILED